MLIINFLARLFPQFDLRGLHAAAAPTTEANHESKPAELDQLLADAGLCELHKVCGRIDRELEAGKTVYDGNMPALVQTLTSSAGQLAALIERYVRVGHLAPHRDAKEPLLAPATASQTDAAPRMHPHQRRAVRRIAAQIAGGDKLELRPHIGNRYHDWPALILGTRAEHVDLAACAHSHEQPGVGQFLDGIKPDRYPCIVPVAPEMADQVQEVLDDWCEILSASWELCHTTFIRGSARI